MRSACLKRFSFLATVSLLLISSPAFSQDSFDSHFRYTFYRFLYSFGEDWQTLKAQGIAESALDPLAVSPAGARGLLQFMPAAWSECQAALGFHASPHHPRASIVCGGWYMRRMGLIWSDPREPGYYGRYAWMLASYNWGPGAVLRAQKRIYGSTRYDHLEPYLPRETREYVRRIALIRSKLPGD